MRCGRNHDLLVQPGDRGRTGTRRRLLVRLERETTTTSSPAWCLIGRQFLTASLPASLFQRAPFLSFSFCARELLSRAPLTRRSLPLASRHQLCLLFSPVLILSRPALLSSRAQTSKVGTSVSLSRTPTAGLARGAVPLRARSQ